MHFSFTSRETERIKTHVHIHSRQSEWKAAFDRRERGERERALPIEWLSSGPLPGDFVSISRQLWMEQTSFGAALPFHKCSVGCHVQTSCLTAAWATYAHFVGKLLEKWLSRGFMCDLQL